MNAFKNISIHAIQLVTRRPNNAYFDHPFLRNNVCFHREENKASNFLTSSLGAPLKLGRQLCFYRPIKVFRICHSLLIEIHLTPNCDDPVLFTQIYLSLLQYSPRTMLDEGQGDQNLCFLLPASCYFLHSVTFRSP